MKSRLLPALFALMAGMAANAQMSVVARPANGSTTVMLQWTSVTNAHHYVIRRTSAYPAWESTAIQVLAPLRTYSMSVSANSAYLFSVIAQDAQNQQLAVSNNALVTTYSFAEPNLVAGQSKISTQHISELRTMTAAARLAAGVGAFPWTNAQLVDAHVAKEDVADLRSALDGALSAVGLTPPAYTDPVLQNSTPTKKLHIEELRARVQGFPLPDPVVLTSLTVDKPSPQMTGVPLTWTAQASGGLIPLEYRFSRKTTTASSWDAGSWSTANVHQWTPSLSEAGDWLVRVEVRSAGATNRESEQISGAYSVIAPLVLSQLSADKVSPQAAGVVINWTPEVTGGVQPWQFRYSRKRVSDSTWGVVQNWGTSSVYTWSTSSSDTGDWQVRVEARSAAGSAPEADRISTVTIYPPIVMNALIVNQPSPQPYGAPITWTPQVDGGLAPLEYSYSRKRVTDSSWGEPVQNWSNASPYTWTPTSSEVGSWDVRVSVRSAGVSTSEAELVAGFTVRERVVVAALVTDKPSPQLYGTTVTWTPQLLFAQSPQEYRYSRRADRDSFWTTVQDWSTTAAYVWTPPQGAALAWQVRVEVRAPGALAAEAGQVSNFVVYQPIEEGTSLNASSLSPHPQGSPVTWTVDAVGGAEPREYAFSRKRASDSDWGPPVQDWGVSKTYTWTPSPSETGNWTLRAEVRSAGVLQSQRTTPAITFAVRARIALFSLTANQVSPQPVGTPVTWTAVATGGTAPVQYRYERKRETEEGWAVARDWSADPTYRWTPDASDRGIWDVRATARSASPYEYETASLSDSFEVTLSEQTTALMYYGDANWPEALTIRTSESLMEGNQRQQVYSYDPGTGLPTITTTSGFNPLTGAAITRTTTTSLYDGIQPAEFNPCATAGVCAFDSSWLTLPQPSGLKRSDDGPRTDVADVTTYVYYPVDAGVPAAWRAKLAAVRNAAGHVSRFEAYDLFGNATRSVDGNGVVTEDTYDLLGRLLTSTIKGVAGCDTSADPLCGSDIMRTRRMYESANGPLAIEIGPRGEATAYEYDARSRTVAMLRGELTGTVPPNAAAAIAAASWKEKIAYEYSPVTGRKLAERFYAREGTSWVEKKSETFAYDASGHLSSVTHPDSFNVAYTYVRGLLQSVKDENHATPNTWNGYDGAGRLHQVRQKLATATSGYATTVYEHDVDGNLRSVTDPNGNVTAYVYDDFGRMVRQQSVVTGTTTYAYDEAGNLVTTIDATGAYTARSYDGLGRVIDATSTRSSASEGVSWVYDAPVAFGRGRLAEMTDPTGSTVYRYNRRGSATSELRTIGERSYLTQFRYDASGNRASIIYPSGGQAMFTFDHAGRSKTVTVDGMTIIGDAAYLPFGPRTMLTFGNGTTQNLQYDARYRIDRNALSTPAGLIAAYDYAYDAKGNVISIADLVDSGYSRVFSYDDLDRLTGANTGALLWGSGSFSYDAMGNMLHSSLGTTALSFSYTGATPKIASVSSGSSVSSVGYDAAGNELGLATEISARNLVIEYASPSMAMNYEYDGRNVRVTRSQRAVGSADAWTTTDSTYSPELNLLSAKDYSSTARGGTFEVAQREVVWFNGIPVAQLDGLSAPRALRYTFTDHLGTPLIQTDPSAAVIWRAEYDPYGSIAQQRSGLGADQPLRFPGQEAEPGSDLSYNIFRWYRAGWGRYTQGDPIGLQGGINAYGYVRGNPVKFVDPLGLKVRTCCKIIPATVDASGALLGATAVLLGTSIYVEPKRHCYFEFGDGSTIGLSGIESGGDLTGAILGTAKGTVVFAPPGSGAFEQRTDVTTSGCGPWSECADDCVRNAAKAYPSPSQYKLLGPNSNTFAGTIERKCPVAPPPPHEIKNAPGWYNTPPQ